MAVVSRRTWPAASGNFEYHWQGPFLEAHLVGSSARSASGTRLHLCVPEDKELARERGILFAADGMGGVSGAIASWLA